MAHDVFISYAEPDRKTADAACHALEAAGVRCWIAPRDVSTGSQYARSIIAGIEGFRLLVLILSSRANQSDFVAREVEQAGRLSWSSADSRRSGPGVSSSAWLFRARAGSASAPS